MKKNEDRFSKKVTQERFEATLRGALATAPKPLKSMTPKGEGKQTKSKKAKKRRV